MTRAAVPPALWAEYAGAHNEYRRARGARNARAARLLESVPPGTTELEVAGVVVAAVRDGRVHYLPPSARAGAGDHQREESRSA